MNFTFSLAIPSLILLDKKGGVITTEGVTCIFNDPDGEVCIVIMHGAITVHVNGIVQPGSNNYRIAL